MSAFGRTVFAIIIVQPWPQMSPTQHTFKDKQIENDRAMKASASCYDEATGKMIGTERRHTAVIVSPDGRYRAYAENEAVASPITKGDSAECQSTSKLFVAGPNSMDFLSVLVISPLPERHGNDIELVDWSPVGHQLLLLQGWWEWGSDVGGNFVRVYDADVQKLSRESFVEDHFSKHFGRSCAAIFRAVGFSSAGNVLLRAEPWFDFGEDTPAADSCVQKEGLWLIDFAVPAVSQLQDDYQVQHYGKIVP
jgi:hypothetical protein